MIKFINNRCQKWLYKKAECCLCVSSCPIEGCISFKDNAIMVNADACVGCGICTTVCPTSALIMENLTDKELWSRLSDAFLNSADAVKIRKVQEASDNKLKNEIVFKCYLGSKNIENLQSEHSSSGIRNINKSETKTPNSEFFINLPCLAILKESHLISLVMSGANSIYLDVANCGNCSFKHGKNTINNTASSAINLLSIIGYRDCIHTDNGNKTLAVKQKNISERESILSFGKNKKENVRTISPSPEYSKREFLFFLSEKAVEKTVESVIGKSEKKIVKRADDIPERRQLLLAVLKGKAVSNLEKIEEGKFPMHNISIDSACSLCHTCGLFCPTGAITRVEKKDSDDETGEVMIDFHQALCMACSQCVELCPEDALHIEKSIDIAAAVRGEIQTLFKKKNSKCPSCNIYFYPEEGREECNICRKRKNTEEIAFNTLFC